MKAVSTALTTYQLFINGEWVDAASGQSFESLNPYTGQPWATIPDGQEPDVDRAVEAARQALDHPDWKRMPPCSEAACCGAWPTCYGRTPSIWARSRPGTTASSSGRCWGRPEPWPATMTTTRAWLTRFWARRSPWKTPRCSTTPCGSRWAWSASSPPGTPRCSFSASAWPRR